MALTSATVTPRNVVRIKMEKKKRKRGTGKICLSNEMVLKKLSQDRKQDELVFSFGVFSH